MKKTVFTGTDTPSAAAGGDEAVPIGKIPAIVEREFGHRPHLATIHRWRIAGVRGVTLNTFLIGARRFVRPSDVRAFMAAINSK